MHRPGRLDASHPLAGVARHHCQSDSSHRNRKLIGGIACGACWELAIRDDERVVVEYGLPREITTDPTYVDAIAVDLACRGQAVHLTPADQAAAVARLIGRGWAPARIARCLRMPVDRVLALQSEDPTPTPARQLASMPAAA